MTDPAGDSLRRLLSALQLSLVPLDAEAQDRANATLAAAQSRRLTCLLSVAKVFCYEVQTLHRLLELREPAATRRAATADLRTIQASWRTLRAAVDALLAEAAQELKNSRTPSPRQEPPPSTTTQTKLLDGIAADEC